MVYPRVCGGTGFWLRYSRPQTGLSPRVRGNPMTVPYSCWSVRSIPACAGEPPSEAIILLSETVYPRVCGGTLPGILEPGCGGGLSPRVRGNLVAPSALPFLQGSIPACAGEPGIAAMPDTEITVYPRVCGGTAWCVKCMHLVHGLSPRVRGNLTPFQASGHLQRSIPACAGEPCGSDYIIRMTKVYPRVCGGTIVN